MAIKTSLVIKQNEDPRKRIEILTQNKMVD